MKRTCIVLLTILALALSMAAQQSTQDQNANPPAQQPGAQQQPPAQAPADQDKKDKDKKDKKDKHKRDKKDKDKDSGGQDVQDTAVFSQREANDVLGQIRDGLEGHSQRLMLGAFDADKMDGYLSFEDQLEAFFERYEGFRVNIRIIQSNIEGGKGIVTATFTMEATPRSGMPTRREGNLRFELEHTKKGWKIVDFNPRGFFS